MDDFSTLGASAAVGGGVVVGVGGQGPPLDVERVVAILEAPDMTSQTGVDPFGTVFEAGLVVPVPHLEGVGCQADVCWKIYFLEYIYKFQTMNISPPCAHRTHRHL